MMKYKALFLGVVLLLGMGNVYAKKYNQKEFDEMVRVYQMLLDNRQEQFDTALEQDAPYEVIVKRACVYTGTWKALLKIGKDNNNLVGANEVIKSATNMSNGLEGFFKELGSTYKETCE